MSVRRHPKRPAPFLTLHGWTAKHYVFTAILVLAVMGMFAYSRS
jgi:hypothetical protein